MDTTTVPAAVAFVVGAIGLFVCVVSMSHAMPTRGSTFGDGWRRLRRPRGRRLAADESTSRRIVTGAPAADRLSPDARPARHPAMRPDVLRRERERLSTEEARRVVAQYVDDDPETLAGVVDQWLADDRRTQDRREGRA